MKYKGWQITLTPNDWGYYEAFSLTDCDASMIFEKTIQDVKDEIDELRED